MSDREPGGEKDARAQLVQALHRLALGDRQAMTVLYERTSAKLFGISLRILGNSEQAEDVTQEIYLSLWKNAGRADAPIFDAARASPMTWLITMARNRAIDRLRKGRRAALEAPIDDALEMVDASLPADIVLEQGQAHAALARCIAQLEGDDAAFIRTSYLQGATQAELAAKHDMPLGTVKSRIRRALVKLRHCLVAGGAVREAEGSA